MIPGRRSSAVLVGVSCYSSDDLCNWTNRGIALHVMVNDSHQITIGSKLSLNSGKIYFHQKSQNQCFYENNYI